MQIKRNDIDKAFGEVKREFPFGPEYISGKRGWVYSIVDRIARHTSGGDRILSVGSGPCDIEAVLSRLGYDVTAFDDLNDQWHVIGKNERRIREFADRMGVDLHATSAENAPHGGFDVVVAIEVLEHIESPRPFLNACIDPLRPDGYLLVTTPNAVHLANRIRTLVGKPTGASTDLLYWNIGDFRGHVKEFTPGELEQIASYSGLVDIQVEFETVAPKLIQSRTESSLLRLALEPYQLMTRLRPQLRDKQILTGRKPPSWTPTEPSIERFSQEYSHLKNYNLDNVPDDEIIDSILAAHR